jgi:hypothetical protein
VFIDLPPMSAYCGATSEHFLCVHLFLDPLAVGHVGANGFLNPGVIKQGAQLFGDKIHEELGIKLLKLKVKISFAVGT